MMLLLGLDVETTGLNAESDQIIEVGAALWHWEKQAPVKLISEIICERPDTLVPKEIEELTGLSTETVHAFGRIPDDWLFAELDWAMAKADYLVAHNAEFDRGFLTHFYRRWGREMPQKPWICTVQDVPYPPGCKAKNLIYLAGYHGFVNPFQHRAVTDVMSMLKVLAHYPLDQVVEDSLSPSLELVAKVSYDQRHLAKERGFSWDRDKRIWKRKIKESQFNQADFPFELEVHPLGR